MAINPFATHLDRSTLERYGLCPHQGHALEFGGVENRSLAMESGIAVHEALAYGVDEFAHGNGFDIDTILGMALNARPDIQADVVDAIRPLLWKIQRSLRECHPDDIMRYDGGAGRRTGQIAVDIGNDELLTSELDLLVQAHTPNELFETDWKSGHTPWTRLKVGSAFQFQLHAWLVFHEYPDVDLLHVRTALTRLGRFTEWFTFDRKEMDVTNWRIDHMLKIRRNAIDAGGGECWPDTDRCARCAAVGECPEPTVDAKTVAADAVAAVNAVTLLTAKAKAITDTLKSYVEGNGPIEVDGKLWGVKPTGSTRKTYGFYGGEK